MRPIKVLYLRRGFVIRRGGMQWTVDEWVLVYPDGECLPLSYGLN